jgi:ADP-L-glycero-D-manno-heptose 6-epimerase
MEYKIIVTGGAGLIGSAVVEELNKMGIEDILIVDHLGTSEKWKNLTRLKYQDYMEKDYFLKVLIRFNQIALNLDLDNDTEVLDSEFIFLENVTHIIHLGACSSTTETNATYLIENNFQYTKHLADFALENSIPFIYASSAATYGLGENGYSDSVDLSLLKPLNMYGYSKHMFDVYAEKMGWLERITGLKYFNVFGFGEEHKADMRSVVLKGYEQISKTGKLQLFKSYRPDYKEGEQKRDFLYVKDAAKITLHLLFKKKYGIYNVGRGVAETWNQLADSLFKAMNRDVHIEYIEMPEALRPKYQYFTKAETSKLLKAGYQFGFTSLDKACEEYVKLLRE